MTEEDKYARKEFLTGAAVVVGTVMMAILMVGLISWGNTVPELKPSTTVVDTYKGCDIIQWHYGPLAEYKYFLYCEKNK
jgi:hypothetical protein